MKTAKTPRPVTVYIDRVMVSLEFTNSNWVKGSCCHYHFHAKVYNVYSKYGIDGGRISKLCIWECNEDDSERREVVSYDRGWDLKPKREDMNFYDRIIRALNMVPIRPEFEM